MQYWGEMESKWGFSDGEAYPAGVVLYRDLYVKTVNRLAEKNGSEVRVVPFDRGGLHNTIMRINVSKSWYEEEYLPKQTGQFFDAVEKVPVQVEIDDAMGKSIEEAMEMGVDDFVVVNPTVDQEFENFLANIN